MSEDFHIPLCMEELMQGPCRIRELLSPTDITCKIDGKLKCNKALI